MKQFQSFIALLCVILMAGPQSYAQQKTDTDNPRGPQLDTESPHWYSKFTRPYEPRTVPPVNVSNGSRMDSLMRAGKLYLSLSDAIALAIENNLDVETERYEFAFAEADLLRAHAGAAIQGIPTNVLTGVPSGAAGTVGSTSSGLGAAGAAGPLSGGLSFDPVITGTVNFAHLTTPQNNVVVTGTTALVSENKTANFSISQAFATGGSAVLSFNNQTLNQNAIRNAINPVTNSNLDLTMTQPLLQGFGLALNNRTIRIAKNNIKAADYVFKQQLINTVANVVNLYWALVAANSTVNVQTQAVAVAQKLYDDNKKQVDIGTLAPIEIVRAQAQLAITNQALVAAQSTVLQYETVLKSALSRNGLANPAISEAHVVPTDPIRIPEVEPVQPIQDLVSKALDNRPDLAQSRIQIENAQVALTGTRNAMLPTLNAVADVRNNALIGSPNSLGGNSLASAPDPFFVGGYSGVFPQLFQRNFPTYSLGVNLTIPLRNRAAQANVATASLNLRQNQLQVQRQINQIRVDVQNALISLQNARAQYQTAVQSRLLTEQTLDADQKKLALGATTVYQLIQDQRDLTTAAGNEVNAQNAYAAARTQLNIATGDVLSSNNVEFDEAKSGHVTKAPSPLPAP